MRLVFIFLCSNKKSLSSVFIKDNAEAQRFAGTDICVLFDRGPLLTPLTIADARTLNLLPRADASYKHARNSSKSRLHNGTRKEILDELIKWANKPEQCRRVHVLHGPAGHGKSTVAYALARMLGEDLGSSFFFFRGENTLKTSLVFPTIVHQLAHSRSDLRRLLVDAVARHVRFGQLQAMSHQFEDLIRTPLSSLPSSTPPITFVLDGLDECPNKGEIVELLRLLCDAARAIPHLRIFLSTRLEGRIGDELQTYTDIVAFQDLQDVPLEVINNDIRCFIHAQLKSHSGDTGYSFATSQELPMTAENLARLSDGCFKYAGDIVEYLCQDEYYAKSRYDTLITSGSFRSNEHLAGDLDEQYNQLLEDAFGSFARDEERMEYIQRVLSIIALSKEALSARDLETATGIPVLATLDVVKRLRSILRTGVRIDQDSDIWPHHPNLPRFLLDSSRCRHQAFFIERGRHSALITHHLLCHMCELSDRVRKEYDEVPPLGNGSGPQGTDDHKLTDVIGLAALQRGSRYACRHWTSHLCDAKYPELVCESLQLFFAAAFEFWISILANSEETKDLICDACVRVRCWAQVGIMSALVWVI